MYEFCKKPCGDYNHFCTKKTNHKGACSHTYYARALINDKKIVGKIIQDSYQTPGNSSKGTIKNRADRCYPVVKTSQEIKQLNKEKKIGCCIPKRFSSTPYDCFQIHVSLTNDTIKMQNGVASTNKDKADTQLLCPICNKEILFEHFYSNVKDHNHINIGHLNPGNGEDSNHYADNVAWVHRRCNTSQGDMTVAEFHQFCKDIFESKII
jgi:hypothetical protein